MIGPARLAVALGATIALGAAPAPAQDVEREAPPATTLDNANYILSSDRLFAGDPEILWPGFLWGLRGFEHFHEPISNPLYFESPLINTQLKFLYLYHEFPDGNALDGGNLDTVALQIRVALTERLAFIATKDGYTWFDPGLYEDEEEGFNDLAVGLKYAFIADQELDLVATAGFRYEWRVGAQRVFMGDNDEISPFVSVAKGWGKFHTMANIGIRIPFDDDRANTVFNWSIHADYEILPGFAPVVEINGLHYLDDAERTPLDIGGADYANLGSTDVSGDALVTLGVGASFKLTPNFSLGATYEFPLTDPDDDIFEQRVTFAATFTF